MALQAQDVVHRQLRHRTPHHPTPDPQTRHLRPIATTAISVRDVLRVALQATHQAADSTPEAHAHQADSARAEVPAADVPEVAADKIPERIK